MMPNSLDLVPGKLYKSKMHFIFLFPTVQLAADVSASRLSIEYHSVFLSDEEMHEVAEKLLPLSDILLPPKEKEKAIKRILAIDRNSRLALVESETNWLCIKLNAKIVATNKDSILMFVESRSIEGKQYLKFLSGEHVGWVLWEECLEFIPAEAPSTEH